MSKVRCLTCKNYVDKEDATKIGLSHVCSRCGILSTYNRNQPKKKKADIPDALRSKILRLDKKKCRFCRSSSSLHLHHVIYRSEGGLHQESNLLTLCLSCHDIVHSDKRRYQRLCLGVIWLRAFGDRQITVPRLEKRLDEDRT